MVDKPAKKSSVEKRFPTASDATSETTAVDPGDASAADAPNPTADTAGIVTRHIKELQDTIKRHDTERSQMNTRHEKDYKDLVKRNMDELRPPKEAA